MIQNTQSDFLTYFKNLPIDKKAPADLNQKILDLADEIIDGRTELSYDEQPEVLLKFFQIKHSGGFIRWFGKNPIEKKLNP